MSCVSPKMPAQRCVTCTGSPTSSCRKDSSDDWIAGRRLLDVGELVEDRGVAEAAEQDPAVGELLPVVEALPRIVRAVVEDAVERLARDHLPAGRPDQIGELGDEAVPVAVGRDEDAVGVERFDVLDEVVLADLRAGRRRERGEATDEARGLDRAVVWMKDRPAEAAGRAAGDVVEPFRRRSRPRAAPRTRAGCLRAPPRRRRGGSCRCAAERRRRARPAVERLVRPPPVRRSACSAPYVSRATS